VEIRRKIKNISETPLLSRVLVLGLIGVGRNVLEVLIGGEWARAWFSLSSDLFFTMFFYPVFLCFFGSMVLHFFSRRFGLDIKMKKIFSVLFFLQLVNLLIPVLDGLAGRYAIPFRLSFIEPLPYVKLIFSPLAFTPLILLFTWPTSLGIDIAWFLTAIVLLNLYIRRLKLPLLRSLLALCISFYTVYMSIYPVYLFFLNEVVRGSNYMFGLFFLVVSVPSVIYVEKMKKRGE
jgi:hypothetical protein